MNRGGGKHKTNNGRVLITYASRFGSSAKIADAIGLALKNQAINVDIKTITELEDLGEYSTVIIGGPIFVGQWYPEIVKFIEAHHQDLKRSKVFYFVVCLTMSVDTPKNRRKTLDYIKPVLEKFPEVKPLDIGLFAGSSTHLPTLMHMVFRDTKLPQGNFVNLDKARKWSKEITSLIA